jgi:ankyrin repeat protein
MSRFVSPLVLVVCLLVGCTKSSSSPVPVASSPAAPAPTGPTGPTGSNYTERTKQLHLAAEKGQISRLLELLGQGANVNDKDDTGETALHRAAAAGQKSAVVVLLARGADPAEPDAQGRTALMRAAEAGNAEVAQLLLDPQKVMTLAGDVLAGVSADAARSVAGETGKLLSNRLYGSLTSIREATDRQGQTALMKAAAGGHVACVQLFFGSGVPLNQRDREGRSALMLAARNGQAAVVDALIEYPGAANGYGRLTLGDVRQIDSAGQTAEQLAESAGHKPAAAAVRRGIALRAARDGHVEVLRESLKTDPAVMAGEKLMLAAAEGGHVPVIQFLMDQWKDRPPAEKLRLMGVGQPDGPRSGTALHFAIVADSPAAIEALTRLDWWKERAVLADYLGRRGFNNLTPMEWANWSGFGTQAKPACAAALKRALDEANPSKK